MLQNPTNDQNILENRYKTIAFCNKPENEDVVKNICSSLRQLKNVNVILF